MKGELKMKERKIIKLLVLCTILIIGLCSVFSCAMAEPKSIIIPKQIYSAIFFDGCAHKANEFLMKSHFDLIKDDVNVTFDEITSDSVIDAGRYTIMIALKDPANTAWADGSTMNRSYEITILPSPLVIRTKSKNAKIGDPAPDLSNPQKDSDYTMQGQVAALAAFERDIENGGLTLSLADNPYSHIPVDAAGKLSSEGTYVISPEVSGTARDNYELFLEDDTLTVTFDNNKKAKIPVFEETTFIYNGSSHQFMSSPNPNGLYRVSSGQLSATDIGTYPVVLKLNDGAKWSDGTTENKTYTFEILPAPLVVQVKNKIAAVGDTAPSLKNAAEGTDFTYLSQPFDKGGIGVSLSYETTPDMTQAGRTKIKATVSGQDAANYQITTANGELIVQAAGNPSDVPIPVLGNTNFLYDGNEQTFMTVASDAGYIATAGSTLKATDVGTYNVTLQLKDKTNTTWSDGTTEDKKYTFEILTASLIVQVTNKSATVGELPPDLTNAQEGTDYIFIQRPATSDLGKITASLTYPDPNLANGRQITLAGNYEISATIQGARATNYRCIVVPGTLAVQAAGDPGKVLIPVLTNTNFLYDGTEKTFMTVASDAGYTAAAGSTLKATDVGTYQVTLQLKDQTNTTWSDGSTKDKVFTFEIWKAPLFVQAKNKITSVGDVAPDLKSAAEGTDYTFLKLPASGDTITVSLSYASTPDMSQAGTTAIKATVSGADAANYEIVTADGMLVVQAAGDPGAVLIPVLTSNNFLYDGTEQTFMTVSADAGYTATTDSTLKGKNVGTYHVTLQLKDKANTTWSDGSTTDKDYTFKIWKAPLVVHVKDKSASVGATAPDLKNAVQGTDYTFLRAPMGGDKINVSLNYAATPDMSQEGTTAIRANVTGQNIENYDVIVAEGTLTVVPDDSPEPPLYSMTQGVNNEWEKGSSEDARFRSTAPYAKFQDVLVDDQLVDPSNYTVSEGSTIIDLKPKFLKMLTAGRHIITIRSTDGKVSCYFWIKNPLPGTGDTGNLPLWFGLFWFGLFAAATAAGILLVKKRKEN